MTESLHEYVLAELQSSSMTESLHEYVLAELQSRRGDWVSIAKAIEMPYGTLKKIANRKSVSPRFIHIETLARYFRAHSPV